MRLLLTLSTALLMACSGGDAGTTADPSGANADGSNAAADNTATDASSSYNLDIPLVKYAWDPQAGDPAVSAEDGGPGFTGEGWDTNLEYPAIGSPDAIKGGEMKDYIPDWPATLRQTGQNWNTSFNYRVAALCFESLLSVHPQTLETIPNLATHWQISEDKSTYLFRINPEARWSDDSEVTAADVVASWKLRVDPKILDPSSNTYYGRLNEPVAVSKYIVEFTVNEKTWNNFLAASGMSIFPAAEIDIPGDQYLDEYQFKYTANTGPYMVNLDDIDTGKTITITRRDDWWARDNPAYVGMYNIDRYKYSVVKQSELAFEKIKKGELDYFVVPKAQWWAEDIPKVDEVKRGLLRPLKIYTDNPIGTAGIAINMQRPPLDDVKIRKALQLLNDRKTKIEKLYFNEYEPLGSYWQGGTYQNPENEVFEYDEFGAVELLEQAGWTEINDDGYRVKDGKILELGLIYRSALSERGLTIFQEACKKAGIKIELQLLTPAASWKNLQGKDYELMSTAWGAIVFPNPESSWHSKYADKPNNNNVTAFADPKVDALIEKYNSEYDISERIGIMRELDGIIYHQHPYILDHFLPSQRVLIWNKFDMPEWGAARTADTDNMHVIWWIDPAKEEALNKAKADSSATLDPGEKENRFWPAWNAAQN